MIGQRYNIAATDSHWIDVHACRPPAARLVKVSSQGDSESFLHFGVFLSIMLEIEPVRNVSVSA